MMVRAFGIIDAEKENIADDGTANEKAQTNPGSARQTRGKNLENTPEWHKRREEEKYPHNNDHLKNDIRHRFKSVHFLSQ
jgi:hypothetical protein